MNTWG